MTLELAPLRPGPLFDEAEKRSAAAEARLTSLTGNARAGARLELWRDLCALGWPLTLVAEEHGGVGADLNELTAIVEGASRNILPLPLPGLTALAPVLLGAGTDVARKRERIASFAAGDLRPAIGLATDLAPWVPDRLRVEASASPTVSGTLGGCETAPDPTHLLLLSDDAAGDPAILLIDLADTGVSVRDNVGLDNLPTLDVDLTASAERLAHGQAAARVAHLALHAGALMTCVEAVSGIAASLRRTADYLQERRQFDQPLSDFQVLRHRCADVYLEFLIARALVGRALDKAQAGDADAQAALGFAKFRTSQAARFTAQQSIQLHGGMGMTVELAANHFNRRLLAAGFAHGDRLLHAERLLAANAR